MGCRKRSTNEVHKRRTCFLCPFCKCLGGCLPFCCYPFICIHCSHLGRALQATWKPLAQHLHPSPGPMVSMGGCCPFSQPLAEPAPFRCPFLPCVTLATGRMERKHFVFHPHGSWSMPFISHPRAISHLSAKQAFLRAGEQWEEEEEEMTTVRPNSPHCSACVRDVCALPLQPAAGCLPRV